MSFELLLKEIVESREAQRGTPLSEEARAALLRETYANFQSADEDGQPEVGDLVVQRDYMGSHVYPNDSTPGILHKVWDQPREAHTLGETNSCYVVEEYNCTVAVLHPSKDGATLMFVPMNLQRLKKKHVAADSAAD